MDENNYNTVNRHTSPPEFGSLNTGTLKDNCPAFEDKCCPFSHAMNDKNRELTKGCLAFKEDASDCPFKQCKTMEEVWDLLAKVPPSHRGNNSDISHVFAELMKDMHTISHEQKQILGECPQFSLSCPFKYLTPEELEDLPLVDEKEWKTWPGLFDNMPPQEPTPGKKESVLSFSKLLKERTKTAHKEAENVAFVRAFLKGKIGQIMYRELIVRLYYVYLEMETQLSKFSDSTPELSAIWFPDALLRTKSLEDDLAHYFETASWREKIGEMSPATKDYCEKIKSAAAKNPLLLIAHAYTRYMGDLSGGQTLKRVAKKAMHLPDDDSSGTNFYHFENISSGKEFKNLFRSRLDGIQLADDVADEVAEEANLVFRLNTNLFREMDVLCGLEEVVSEPRKASGACPFMNTKSMADSESKLMPGSESKCPVTKTKRILSKQWPILLSIMLAVFYMVYLKYILL